MESRNQDNQPLLVDSNSGVLSFSADGNVNWPRALRLIRQAQSSRVGQMVVTTSLSQMYTMLDRMQQLDGMKKQHAICLEFTPAVELKLTQCLFEEAVHVSTVVGGLHRRYIFLRLPEVALPIVPVIRSFRHMKLTPVLLSPERFSRYLDNASDLVRCVQSGALIQLSAASLMDQTDRDRVQFCKFLIRKNLCHLVASETGRYHDLPISLGDAYQTITRWFGRSRADAICCDNPGKVFVGEDLRAPTSRRRKLNPFSRSA